MKNNRMRLLTGLLMQNRFLLPGVIGDQVIQNRTYP
jgi:hypothetical protein